MNDEFIICSQPHWPWNRLLWFRQGLLHNPMWPLQWRWRALYRVRVCVGVSVFVCVCARACIQPERGFFCINGFVFHLLCYTCCPSSTDDNILMSAYNTKKISITIVSPHTQARTHSLTHAHVAWFYLAQPLKFRCVFWQGLELNSIGINLMFTYQEQISEHFVLFPVWIPLCPSFCLSSHLNAFLFSLLIFPHCSCNPFMCHSLIRFLFSFLALLSWEETSNRPNFHALFPSDSNV